MTRYYGRYLYHDEDFTFDGGARTNCKEVDINKWDDWVPSWYQGINSTWGVLAKEMGEL